MKYIFIFFIYIYMSNVAYAKNFIAGFEDIPMMEGLIQLNNTDIAFGNEETHFIETQMMIKKKNYFDEIKNFYIETLPQLGWKLITNNKTIIQFRREADVLEINKLNNYPTKISITLKNSK